MFTNMKKVGIRAAIHKRLFNGAWAAFLRTTLDDIVPQTDVTQQNKEKLAAREKKGKGTSQLARQWYVPNLRT